jgi:hypothetical protein
LQILKENKILRMCCVILVSFATKFMYTVGARTDVYKFLLGEFFLKQKKIVFKISTDGARHFLKFSILIPIRIRGFFWNSNSRTGIPRINY